MKKAIKFFNVLMFMLMFNGARPMGKDIAQIKKVFGKTAKGISLPVKIFVKTGKALKPASEDVFEVIRNAMKGNYTEVVFINNYPEKDIRMGYNYLKYLATTKTVGAGGMDKLRFYLTYNNLAYKRKDAYTWHYLPEKLQESLKREKPKMIVLRVFPEKKGWIAWGKGKIKALYSYDYAKEGKMFQVLHMGKAIPGLLEDINKVKTIKKSLKAGKLANPDDAITFLNNLVEKYEDRLQGLSFKILIKKVKELRKKEAEKEGFELI